ncbi:MAG: hypothetical protein R2827_03205 [Bdellovibrionales bacterium]
MIAWLSSLFKAIYDFVKKNIPAIAIAVYDHLQHKIKRKENENLELKTELEIEKEKKAHEDATRDLSDADYVDDFISKGKRDE